MPRQKAWIKRHGVSTAKLDPILRWQLLWGDYFGIRPTLTRSQTAEAWQRHGHILLEQYMRAYPGSRPMACYILGEVEPLPPHPKPVLRAPLAIVGLEELIETTGHQREEELRHLLRLGVVQAEEEARARHRLEQPDATSPHRMPE